MIVDQFCTSVEGGAGRTARRLHQGLVQLGVPSRFHYAWGGESVQRDGSLYKVPWPQGPSPALLRPLVSARRNARKLVHKIELKSAIGLRSKTGAFSAAKHHYATPFDASRSNVIHLHWIAKMIDYPTFFGSLPDDIPIVWTLHDMNPFTGGCHYSGGCQTFETGCHNCPMLTRRGEHDLSYRTAQLKRVALQGKDVHVVAPSKWLIDLAAGSEIFSGANGFHHIQYGLDLEAYAPQHKKSARKQFSLPDEAIVVGFGADFFDERNRRKGFPELITALARLRTKDKVVGLVFGQGDIPQRNDLPEIRSAGFIGDQATLADAYSAMDLFALPSLEDNSPLTGLEAMACGTPVVSFKAGGVPEYVRHHVTGLTADVGDCDQLAEQIDWLVDRPHECRRMGAEARTMIEREFSLRTQATTYLALYNQITNQASGHGVASRVA